MKEENQQGRKVKLLLAPRNRWKPCTKNKPSHIYPRALDPAAGAKGWLMHQILGGSVKRYFLHQGKARSTPSRQRWACVARYTPVIELLIYFTSMYLFNEGRWLFNK